MKNKIPKIVIVNDEPQIVGDFTFELSEIVYDSENYTPIRKLSFEYCPDTPYDLTFRFGNDKINKLFLEKVSADFKNFLNNLGSNKL